MPNQAPRFQDRGRFNVIIQEFKMEQQQAATALIVGASRGLGLGLTREYLKRGWKVIATERGHDPASALRSLASEVGQALQIEQLDINQPEQIQALAQRLRGVSLELLFVNAGVSPDMGQTSSQISTEEFTRVLISNALSPIRVIDALEARITAKGTIAVMSSAMGSVAGNTEGGNEIYRASKAALNSLMHSYAARAGGEHCLGG